MTARLPAGCQVTHDRLVALAALAEAPPPAGAARSDTGGLSGPKQGMGGDIFDLRPYQAGDDPRHIDAAATARSGRTQIRRRHQEADRTVLLVADFRPPMLWGTRGRLRSVAAAEALALEGWRTVLAGGRAGVLIAHGDAVDSHPPRPRDRAMIDIARALARAHVAALARPGQDTVPLGAILAHAASQLRPGATMILATGLDTPGDSFAAAAEAVMRRNRLEVLLVQDPVETDPPPGSFAMRLAGGIAHARFGPSPSKARLDALGIPARIVRTDAPPHSGAAA